MKSNIRRAALFTIAIVAGMFAASALPAQTSPQMIQGYSDVVEADSEVRDDYLRAHNSLARIRAYKGTQLQWMGSANAFLRADGKIYLLSNSHVMGGDVRITAEFFVNGRSQGEHTVTVLMDTKEDGNDIAVGSVVDKNLDGVELVPLSPRTPMAAGDDVYWVGASSGEHPNGQLGSVQAVTNQYFYYLPTSIPGDSGSSIISFDSKGNPSIAGLTAWYSTQDGVRNGMAMHTNIVLAAIKGFRDIKPKSPKVEPERVQPPQKRPFRKFFRGLRGAKQELDAQLPRFQELLGKLNRINEEQRIRNDHYNKMAAERIAELEEAKLFQGRLLDRIRGLNDKVDDIKNFQSDQQSLTDKLLGSMNAVTALVRLAKILFWMTVALLIASLLFKQGWATTLIISISVFFFKTVKLFIALVKNALVSKMEAPASTQDAIDDIREGIEDGVSKP